MRILRKKCCEWCNKSFMTYEENKIFCTDTCIAKKKYSELFYLKKPIQRSHPCRECGDEILKNGTEFCNHKCRQKYKYKNLPKKQKDPSKKNNRKAISYDELNRREEYKRVFDDEWAARHMRGYKW